MSSSKLTQINMFANVSMKYKYRGNKLKAKPKQTFNFDGLFAAHSAQHLSAWMFSKLETPNIKFTLITRGC